MRKTELNTSELVDLLQKSAVQYLTTCRQLMARDFGSVATTVTTDYEAMYKRVQTWRLSAVFTVVYTERTHAIVCLSCFLCSNIFRVYSVAGR